MSAMGLEGPQKHQARGDALLLVLVMVRKKRACCKAVIGGRVGATRLRA
jgi:hypothetical protein